MNNASFFLRKKYCCLDLLSTEILIEKWSASVLRQIAFISVLSVNLQASFTIGRSCAWLRGTTWLSWPEAQPANDLSQLVEICWELPGTVYCQAQCKFVFVYVLGIVLDWRWKYRKCCPTWSILFWFPASALIQPNDRNLFSYYDVKW